MKAPFGPDSELWRINLYATGLVFGPSEVLMQIAHPRVAQGVSDSSRFREDALGRLRRTLQTVNQIVFGTGQAAAEMRVRLTAVHDCVQGPTSHQGYPVRRYIRLMSQTCCFGYWRP